MRQGRYRYQMLEVSQLQKWAPGLEALFAEWQKELHAGMWSEWEFVAHYLLVFVFLDRPKEKWSPQPRSEFWQGFNSVVEVRARAAAERHLAGLVPPEQLKRWGDCASWVYGPMKNLRGVPEKVLLSLRAWRQGAYPLFLLHRVPTAEELLAYQVEGRRCVSALLRREEMITPVEEGRDVWSFCLHDLLHASHFFTSPEQTKAQRYLSQFFLQAWKSSPLKEWLMKDSEFAADFEYVAADMNAHPVYILLSFYAKTLECFKRQKGWESESIFTPAAEKLWQERWHQVLESFVSSSVLLEEMALFPHNKDLAVRAERIQRELEQLGTQLGRESRGWILN